jgi:CubicO group peptidase (beta-lactamase class C family)
MIATSKKIRLTVDEYFRMSDAGVFDGKRVELIEGRIVRMHAQAHPHRWCLSKARRKFDLLFPPNKFWVLVQGTLLLGRYGAPDPDLHVFAGIRAAVDSIVNAALTGGRAAGVSVGVVRGRDTLVLKAYGSADLELDVPTPDRAGYEIGSVTKQFTSAAILLLVEQGKISLDDQ